jgi:hypothetical protein
MVLAAMMTALLLVAFAGCGGSAATGNPADASASMEIANPVATPTPTPTPKDVLILGVWKMEGIGTYRFTSNGELLVTFDTGAEEAYSYTAGDKYLTFDMGDRGKTENKYSITKDTLTFFVEFDQKHVLKKIGGITDSDYEDN